MIKKLAKIQKISMGILQLFTSMDKGFSKVEPDIAQLKKFRCICYEVSEKLLVAVSHLFSDQTMVKLREESSQSASFDKIHRQRISQHLMYIRHAANEGLDAVENFIDEYQSREKSNYALDALEKFKNLLERDIQFLEQEINNIRMQFILSDRKESLEDSVKDYEPEDSRK